MQVQQSGVYRVPQQYQIQQQQQPPVYKSTVPYPAASQSFPQQQQQRSQVAQSQVQTQKPQQQYQQSPSKSRVQEEIQTSESHSRVKYLRKMYLLLFIQLLFATWLADLTSVSAGFSTWVNDNYIFTYCIAGVILLAIQLVALFQRSAINQYPQNIVFYVLHAIAFAFFFAYWEIQRENDSYITYGLLFYTIVILSLYIHVIFARNEITFQVTSLYILGGVYLLTLLFVIFVTISNLALYTIAILSILWGFFIVWENETVIGAKNEWSKEDFYSGAIAVYMYIFILILKLVELIKQLIIKARQ